MTGWIERFRAWLHGADPEWRSTGYSVTAPGPYDYQKAVEAKAAAEQRARLRRKVEAQRGERVAEVIDIQQGRR